jgi:hypothetical protein
MGIASYPPVSPLDYAALDTRLDNIELRPGRNVIRNGDMSVAQRGVGPLTVADGTVGIDGWTQYSVGCGTTGGIVSLGVTFAPFKNYGSFTISTAASSAGYYGMVAARIEDVRTLAGQQVTLSFYAGASVAGRTLGVGIKQYFGLGGSPSANFEVPGGVLTQVLTGSLVRYSVTFTMPSVSAKTLGTTLPENNYLEMQFWLGAGSNNVANSGLGGAGAQAAWTLTLTGVQLEAGPVATPFERLPQQAQLAWCQRYYYRHVVGTFGAFCMGMAYSTVGAFVMESLPVPMRTLPTLGNGGNLTIFSAAGAGIALTGITIDAAEPGPTVRINPVVASGLVAGNATGLAANASGSYLEFSAEL